jgi:hypothetical protein
MEPSPAQQAARDRIAAELARAGFALPGTLIVRSYACGKPNCRCHADPPRLHGPYAEWTRKIAGKTITRRLTPDELAEYQPLFDNAKKLRTLLADLQDLTLQIIEDDGTQEPLPRRTGGACSGKRGLSTLNLWAAPSTAGIRPGQPQT